MKHIVVAAVLIAASNLDATQAKAALVGEEGHGEVEIADRDSAEVTLATSRDTAITQEQVPAVVTSVSNENADSVGEKDWNVSLTPYLWVAGLSANIGIPRDGNDVDVNQSFADVFGKLNFGFMGTLDVEHRRAVFIADLIYLNVGVNAEAKTDPGFSAKVNFKQVVGTAMAGYRIIKRGPLFVDLLAGARLTSLNVDLTLENTLGQKLKTGFTSSKLAPLIGARANIPLGTKWGVGMYGDVGSIFGSSDIRWQLLGTLHRDLGKNWQALIGYRHMHLQRDRNDAKLKVDVNGPLVGIKYKF